VKVIERVKPWRRNGVWTWAASVVMLALAGCGGGGNESGPPDSIEVSPAAVTVGEANVCFAGLGPKVYIHGGRPPYKLSNTVPQGMRLDRSVVQNSGDSFTITFINGVCMENMPIVIEDEMGRLAKVTVNNGV
jgi:hypothetical protein